MGFDDATSDTSTAGGPYATGSSSYPVSTGTSSATGGAFMTTSSTSCGGFLNTQYQGGGHTTSQGGYTDSSYCLGATT